MTAGFNISSILRELREGIIRLIITTNNVFYMYAQHRHTRPFERINIYSGWHSLNICRPFSNINMSLLLLWQSDKCLSVTYNILIMWCLIRTFVQVFVTSINTTIWCMYDILPFYIHISYQHWRIYMLWGHLSRRLLRRLLSRSRETTNK